VTATDQPVGGGVACVQRAEYAPEPLVPADLRGGAGGDVPPGQRNHRDSSLFAAVLGVNPVQHVLATTGTLATLPTASRHALTGRTFFPHLIAVPFQHGLMVVLAVATALSVIAALASLLRGGRYVHPADADEAVAAPPGRERGVIPEGRRSAVSR
jgi:hypothetical protein